MLCWWRGAPRDLQLHSDLGTTPLAIRKLAFRQQRETLSNSAGSLVLGLAVSRGALDPGDAWELSRIDETWQAGQWGEDAEAQAQAERRHADFLRAEHFLQLLTQLADN